MVTRAKKEKTRKRITLYDMNTVKFSFEDLEVWQKAIDFADKVISLTEIIQTDRKHFRLIEVGLVTNCVDSLALF